MRGHSGERERCERRGAGERGASEIAEDRREEADHRAAERAGDPRRPRDMTGEQHRAEQCRNEDGAVTPGEGLERPRWRGRRHRQAAFAGRKRP